MNKLIPLAALTLLSGLADKAELRAQASAAIAAGKTKPSPLAPSEIVAAAPKGDWVTIPASDLLVMDLTPDAKGRARRVVIQLMPPPFSQGWIGNIRKLASARFWDGLSINRVQDNYVVQWGDANASEDPPTPDVEKLVMERLDTYRREHPRASRSELKLAERRIRQATMNAVASEALASTSRSKAKALPEGLMTVPENAYTSPVMEELIDDPIVHGHVIRPKLIEMPWNPDSGLGAAFGGADDYAERAGFVDGWPIAGSAIERKLGEVGRVWPVHCYGMVGVGRDLSPNTGSGAELYVVIGHAPRHLDRNIALVGRVIEGIEHLSSLPRGTGGLGFYETAEEQVPIASIRLASDLDGDKPLPSYEYLSTESASFAKYADARANRRDAFFIKPAGGADICNIPVPVRRAK